MRILRSAHQVFTRQPLVAVLFSVLFACLFLGDGKQGVVDIAGAGLVLLLHVIARFFGKQQRSLPKNFLWAWTGFLVYVIIRTVFSDDVGFSLYATTRFIEAFLLFYVFYSYATDGTAKVFIQGTIVLSLAALLASFVFALVPGAVAILPKMNLLVLTFGHNHVVDLLFPSFVMSFLLWWYTRKPLYAVFTCVFVLGTIYSFARAALIFETAIVLGFSIRAFIRKQRAAFPALLGIALAGITLILILLPYKQIAQNSRLLPQYSKAPILRDGRFAYWKQAVLAIRDRPVFGAGPGTFVLLSRRYQAQQNTYSWFAHSFFLEQLAETGCIGGGLLGVIFFLAYRDILVVFRRNFHKDNGVTTATKTIVFTLVLFLTFCLVDYSLNYFIVWGLFWSMLGVTAGSMSSYKSKIPQSLGIPTPPLTILVGLYILMVVSSLGTIPMVSAINADHVSSLLKNNPPASVLRMVHLLHLRNPDVIREEGRLGDAYALDPQNMKVLHDYFDILISKKDARATANFIVSETDRLLPGKAPTVDLNMITEPLLFTEDLAGFVGTTTTREEFFAKIYYYMGYQLLITKPGKTLIFWTLARDLAPGWGYFHVELASLEKYVFQNESNAKTTLTSCLLYPTASRQCLDTQIEAVGKPGLFYTYVQKIPDLNQ